MRGLITKLNRCLEAGGLHVRYVSARETYRLKNLITGEYIDAVDVLGLALELGVIPHQESCTGREDVYVWNPGGRSTEAPQGVVVLLDERGRLVRHSRGKTSSMCECAGLPIILGNNLPEAVAIASNPRAVVEVASRNARQRPATVLYDGMPQS